MKKSIFLIILTVVTTVCYSQVITATGSYNGPPGFDRGYQSTQYCGNNPESWVRGSAWLNKQNGLLSMQIQLETDATHAGPKGQVAAYVFDSYGNLLTRVSSSEVGIGGKPPGKAVMYSFQAAFFIDPQLASRASSVVVEARCTGSSFQFWGVSLDTVKDAMGLIQQFAMFFF